MIYIFIGLFKIIVFNQRFPISQVFGSHYLTLYFGGFLIMFFFVISIISQFQMYPIIFITIQNKIIFRFTQFTGIPNMNRFPLQLVPTNRFQRRLPPSRIPYRPGTPRRGSSSQDRPLVSPRFLRQPPNRLSDNKVGWSPFFQGFMSSTFFNS